MPDLSFRHLVLSDEINSGETIPQRLAAFSNELRRLHGDGAAEAFDAAASEVAQWDPEQLTRENLIRFSFGPLEQFAIRRDAQFAQIPDNDLD